MTPEQIVIDLNVFLGILVIGFLIFGYLTKARIFWLAASAILLFIAVVYVEFLALFLPLLGISIFLFVFTFLGAYGDE